MGLFSTLRIATLVLLSLPLLLASADTSSSSTEPLASSDDLLQHYYCEVLEKSLQFYKSQRAEDELTGGAKELYGGYYDSGAQTKSTMPMASSMTLLAWGLIDYGDAVVACGLYEEYMDTLKWGSDYIMRAHAQENVLVAQVGAPNPIDPTAGPSVFIVSPAKPGADLAMNAASALASFAVLMKNRDADYHSLLVRHARELYSFAYIYPGVYSESLPQLIHYKSYSYETELVWGSTWLYRATGQPQYLANAKDGYKKFNIAPGAACHSLDWTHKGAGVIMNMYKSTGDSDYLKDAAKWFQSWMPGKCVSYTTAGFAKARDHGLLRHTSGAAFVALMLNTAASKSWGESQIKYMLGKNPESRSFMLGYGNSANGIVGAINGRPDELKKLAEEPVGIDHNAGFTAAVCILARLDASRQVLATARQGFQRPSAFDVAAAFVGSNPTRTRRSQEDISGQLTLELHPGANPNWFAVAVDSGVEDVVIERITLTDSSDNAQPQNLSPVSWERSYWLLAGSEEGIVAPFTLDIRSSSGKTVTITMTSTTPSGIFSIGPQF